MGCSFILKKRAENEREIQGNYQIQNDFDKCICCQFSHTEKALDSDFVNDPKKQEIFKMVSNKKNNIPNFKNKNQSSSSNNIIHNSIVQLNNNINDLTTPKVYKIIKTDKITNEDLNKFFESNPPINDGIELETRPPIEFEDKSIYYGEWDKSNNLRHGRGIKLWIEGTRFEGYWSKDKATGKGKIIHSDGDIYEGDWLDNLPNGRGTYTHKDGTKYEGDWKNNKQDGQGKEFWSDGSNYFGGYKDGKKQGHGELKWPDGSSYIGNFDNNIMNGKGTYIFPDKRKYNGDWVNGKMNGHGVFTWPDGRKYIGEYKNDKKEGFGKYTWNERKIYNGFWKNGKQHGEGTVFTPRKQSCRKGIFENGKLVKWLEEVPE